jgi:divalent metal cation (Fe/Co/Zn/Cd) transporter
MKKALQVLGAFVSFIVVVVGAVIMAMELEIISGPVDPNLPALHRYYLDWRAVVGTVNPIMFYVGCGMVSVGLTFFWFQRRK